MSILVPALLLIAACADPIGPASEGSGANLDAGRAVLELSEVALDAYMGETVRLEARLRTAGSGITAAADVNWTVGDSSIVRVDDGLVIPLRAGATSVEARRGDLSASGTIRTLGPTRLDSVRVLPGSLKLEAGTTTQLSVRLDYSNGIALAVRAGVDWSSTDSSVAAVREGAITGVSTGNSRVVASLGTLADTVDVRVVEPVRMENVLYGLHMDLTWYADRDYRSGMIERAQQVHASVSRNSLLWHLVEPVKGTRDWTVLDSTVDDLLATGIQPLMAVYGSPTWANGTPAAGNPYHYLHVPTDSVAYSRWVEEYKMFVRAAARRYRGRVQLWELGNEQNYEHFWRPRPNVAQYARWYEELRSVIKAENPDAIVSVGGLTLLAVPASKIGPNINGVSFMSELYAHGVMPDAVAVHPYTDGGSAPDARIAGAQNFGDLEAIRAVMLDAGQGQTPIWITEWGWSTSEVTPERQAAYLRRSLELIATRYSSFVTIATYFALTDFPPHYSHGLFDAEGTMKPSGEVFRDFVRP